LSIKVAELAVWNSGQMAIGCHWDASGAEFRIFRWRPWLLDSERLIVLSSTKGGSAQFGLLQVCWTPGLTSCWMAVTWFGLDSRCGWCWSRWMQRLAVSSGNTRWPMV
jgi:hypothetical protein